MSLGFSLSDIVVGYSLASEIYYRCFTQAQGANVKYLQFGREINLLGESLKRLEKIIDNANVQRPRRPWHNQADNVNPNTLREVTGDFLATLNDCQTLLDDNSRFSRSSSNFVDNVIWWSSVEREVVNLKERVAFHVLKTTVIAKPFETQLLLGIRRELQRLRRDVADLRGVVIQSVRRDNEQSSSPVSPIAAIPESLVLRFTDALYRDKPKSFDILGHLPLREAFDALVFNFSHSTVEFNPRPELGLNIPEEPQYLNLLKSRWLIGCIEDSYHFRAAGPDSLWADYLRELKDDVRDQFRGFEGGNLVAPPCEVLLRLPNNCFSIWVIEETPVRPPDLAEQRPFEEKILELCLPSSYSSRQCALTVFRKSDAEFRLVSTTKDERNPLFHREESMDINMNLTKLVPAYANPEQSSRSTLNVLLCANEAQNPKWYTFKDLGDVKRFQQALTGYRVFHNMSKIAWSIEGSMKPHKSGDGSLQLWHYKPLPSMTGELDKYIAAQVSPTIGSPPSPPLYTPKLHRHSTAMTSVTWISTGSITSSVTGSQGDGTAMLRPKVPVLVMFTMCERRYGFLHIKLDQTVSIRPDLCACRKSKNTCRRVILGGKTGVAKTIDIRRHRADQEGDRGLDSWDLARFRYPQHAKFKELETIKKKQYICLDFPTTTEKDEFLDELGQLEYLRNLDIKAYDQKFNEKKYLANNPGKRRGS